MSAAPMESTINEMCRGVLRLSFPDAEVPSDLYTEASLFSPEHAREIWTFAQRSSTSPRSSASSFIATRAALARVLNDDDTEFFGGRYRPNMRVYRILLEARPPSLP